MSRQKEDTKLEQYFQPKSVSCPVCFQLFNIIYIEKHASECCSKFDHDLDTDDEDINETVPYVGIDFNNIGNGKEEVKGNSEKEKEIKFNTYFKNTKEDQVTLKDDWINCRRCRAWEDYCCYVLKDWTDCKRNLKVRFLKEAAIDTGGPKNEFFQGRVVIFYIIIVMMINEK